MAFRRRARFFFGGALQAILEPGDFALSPGGLAERTALNGVDLQKHIGNRLNLRLSGGWSKRTVAGAAGIWCRSLVGISGGFQDTFVVAGSTEVAARNVQSWWFSPDGNKASFLLGSAVR